MHARKNRIDQMTSREYALDAFKEGEHAE